MKEINGESFQYISYSQSIINHGSDQTCLMRSKNDFSNFNVVLCNASITEASLKTVLPTSTKFSSPSFIQSQMSLQFGRGVGKDHRVLETRKG